MDLTVTLDDGTTLPLAECDWALLRPCGCAEAISLAVVDDDEVLATAQMAFAGFEPTARKRESMIGNGYTVKLMRRHEASDLFLAKCVHESIFRSVVTCTGPDGSSWTNVYGPYRTRNTARGVATLKNRSRNRWGIEDPVKRETVIQRATVSWEDLP